MNLDKDLILRLEKLARLRLSEAEREQMLNDLNRILIMVEKLQSVDTTGIEPLIHLAEETPPLRIDAVSENTTAEQALQNAPFHDGTFFKVPKVV